MSVGPALFTSVTFVITNHRGSPHVQIAKERFDGIIRAKQGLFMALAIEEKFSMVLENFREFEQECLNLTLRRMVFSPTPDEWSHFQDDIYNVNRRLANLLSACRLYIDHVPHELSAVFGSNSEFVSYAKQSMSAEYDGHLAYRAMEAMRNYLQHRTIPLAHLAFGAGRDTEATAGACHTITPSILISELQGDKKLKATVVHELSQIAKDGRVGAMPLIRGYVECLGRVHRAIRQRLEAEVTRWDRDLEEAYNEGVAAGMGKHIIVRSMDDFGAVLEEADVFLEGIRRRRYLEQKSAFAAHLARHYVSGRAD